MVSHYNDVEMMLFKSISDGMYDFEYIGNNEQACSTYITSNIAAGFFTLSGLAKGPEHQMNTGSYVQNSKFPDIFPNVTIAQ
jgi:hypothetical protein